MTADQATLGGAESPEVVRGRAVSLVEYLLAVRSQIEKPTRAVPSAHTFWQADLPVHPFVQLGRGVEDADWLRVGMPVRPEPPKVPRDLRPFVAEQRPDSEPEIDRDAVIEDDDLDAVRSRFEWWRDNEWRRWAVEANTIERVRQLHRTLFELQHLLDMQTATDELVWGHGIMELRVGEHRVRYPLVVSPVTIEYDPEQPAVSVVPSGPARLQVDPLTGMPEQHLRHLLDLAQPGGLVEVDVWDELERRELFERALSRMGLDPVVREAGAPDPGVPHIHDTGVLFVRPRQRMLRRFLESFRNRLLDGSTETIGSLASILAHEPSRLAMPADRPEAWRPVGERLLMPLATNEAQESIARRLALHRSVAVQGPPGTGKTHTIRNLICHLMAYGKRVLVVAQKEDPLRVLRDGLPEEVQALCLAVLGRSSDQLTQLQLAARELSDRASTLDQHAAQLERDRLAKSLEQAERDLAQALVGLRTIAEGESATFELEGVELGAREVGAWLAREAAAYGDIPDAVPPDTPAPLTSEEFTVLLASAAALTKEDRREALRELPVAADLPAADAARRDRARLAEAGETIRRLSDQRVEIGAVRSAGQAWVEELRGEVEEAVRLLAAREGSWAERLSTLVSETHWAESWQDHQVACQELLDDLMGIRRIMGVHEVSIAERQQAETWQLPDRLRELRQRLADGKPPKKLFHPAQYKLAEDCRVDGRPLRTADEVDVVLSYLDRDRLRQELRARWTEWMRRLDGPAPDPSLEPEMWAGTLAAQAAEATEWNDQVWPALRSRIVRLARSVPTTVDSAALGTIATLLGQCREVFVSDRLSDEVRAVATYLQHGAATENASDLWRLLDLAWNDPDLPRWDDLLDEVRRLAALRPDVQRYEQLRSRLAVVAPSWAAEIDSGTAAALKGTGADCLRRWRWRQTQTWFDAAVGSVDPDSLGRRVEQARERIRRLTQELVVASAWLEVSRALDDRRRAALADWATALRKIGKGTGKNAAMWQAHAQTAMSQAVDAVPVWVMTVDRAIEQFAGGAKFDVVIVDEASQADMFALPVLSLGARAVVVGDDQQIGPQLPFVGGVMGLISSFLKDVPSAEHFDNESSLYDHAVRRSPQRILLTEHFRCVPAIIDFSSRTYYDGAIEPLRSDVPAGIGDPVNAVYVPDGIRQTLAKFGEVNVPEAEALVERLGAIVADPAYRGKTIGVISLLSTSGQALYLLDRIRETIGAEEMARRDLRVGDSYTFQGDERDIVLISTVVSPHNGAVAAFTRREFHRRINVAASRAKDQMWVFHSIEPSELRSDDARALLLDYCRNVKVADTAYDDLEARCESDFERAVLRSILLRGYRPQPQFRIGRNRIDFVLPAPGGKRLAIECDGDPYHGPDQWEADIRRQAILERVGNCVFVRIRGSVFARDPDAALEPLWQRIEELRIQPTASGDRDLPGTEEVSMDADPTEAERSELEPAGLELFEQAPATGKHRAEPEPEPEPVDELGSGASVQYAAPDTFELLTEDADPADQGQTRIEGDSRAVSHNVPAGYKSVAWLRPEEAEAALHAYNGRRDVPVRKNNKVTGWARYHSSGTDLARKYLANVLVERAGAAGPRIVCWVRDYEATAVVRAARTKQDLPFKGTAGRRPGLVQYFPPDSDSARRFRSVTRLLRARAEGRDGQKAPGAEQDAPPTVLPAPEPPGDSAVILDGPRRAGPPLQPGYAISIYTRAELQALIRWVLADGQPRSYEELVAAAADVLDSPSRREQIEGSLHSAIRSVVGNDRKRPEADTGGSGRQSVRTSEVRTWARSNGLPVSDRGRLSEDVITAYNRTHPGRPFAG
ncbi:AAA domain-containing protein [Actinopolymorpha singaporensis]